MSFFWGKTFERDLEEMSSSKGYRQKSFVCHGSQSFTNQQLQRSWLNLESVLSRNRVNHRFFLKAKVTVIVWHSIETLKKTLAMIAVSLNWEVPSYHQT